VDAVDVPGLRRLGARPVAQPTCAFEGCYYGFTTEKTSVVGYFIAKYAQMPTFNSNLTSYKYCTMKLIIYRVKHMNLQITCADNVCQIDNLKAINRHI